jgi:hypothetical protein
VQISGGFLPIRIQMQVNARVAVFAFIAGIASGVLAGLIPAIRCANSNLDELMRSAGPGRA